MDKKMKFKYFYGGMGGNHLYESADVVYQCPAGTSLLPYDEGDRRVCCKSDDGVHGLGDRLLRRALRARRG